MRITHSKSRRAINNSILLKTYRISIIEGIFSQVYSMLANIGSSFITKFMVILGASPLHFSLLSAIGQVSAVFQPIGVAITLKLKQKKKTCIFVTGIGRFLSYFIICSILFRDRITGIWFLLGLLLISAAFQSAGANIWIAWISELIPVRFRGRFFSKRSQYLLIAGLFFSYSLSFVTDLFEPGRSSFKSHIVDYMGAGQFFQISNQTKFIEGIFVFATTISLIGLFLLSKQPVRPSIVSTQESLRKVYSKPFKEKNYRLLIVFVIWWMFAIGVGSAFWGPFMLTKLKMTLFEMSLYGSLNAVSSLMAYNFWGKFIDKNGNKTAMKICVILGGLNPMFWLFMNANNYSIIWIEALISGFMWSGASIVATNFALSIAKKGQEQVYSGLYGAIGGFSMMTSTLLSGILYPAPETVFGLHLQSEQVIFGIGGILRWSAFLPLIFVREPSSVSLSNIINKFFEKLRDRS